VKGPVGEKKDWRQRIQWEVGNVKPWAIFVVKSGLLLN
jgi:hypothetical protein